jgi:hypothetical protein
MSNSNAFCGINNPCTGENECCSGSTTNGKYGKCSFFPIRDINFLVNGINEEKYYYCSTSRDSNDMCGEEGKYYKKKTVKIGILNGKKIDSAN